MIAVILLTYAGGAHRTLEVGPLAGRSDIRKNVDSVLRLLAEDGQENARKVVRADIVMTREESK